MNSQKYLSSKAISKFKQQQKSRVLGQGWVGQDLQPFSLQILHRVLCFVGSSIIVMDLQCYCSSHVSSLLLLALFLRSGRWSLLPSLAECQLPGGQHVRILQGRSFFAVKSRSEDDWSAQVSSPRTIVICSEGLP